MSEHRVVLASAGTGKTFQLTNRFIRLLARGVDPSTILATTFTRKAAGEILQRILSRLAGAAVSEKSLAELREHVDESLTRERCAELAAQLASSIHRLNVKTLDSFFAWVTGCFGLEMGIAPGWRIIDEQEDADLRGAAIQEALGEADREQLIAFLEMLHGGGNGRTVHGAIERAVRSAHGAWVETASRPEAWACFGPERDPLDDEALEGALARLRRVAMPLNKSGSTDRRWQRAHEGNVDAALGRDWERLVSNGLAACIVQGKYEYYKQAIPEAVIAVYEPVVEHARSCILRVFLARNLATRELMERFDRAYQRAKEKAGALRFEDVPRRMLAHPLDGRLEHLYYRLDARLQHVLLDEFQDTSLEQFELIEPVLDEILSRAEGSVFIVGDVKQSLYSWRGAEPELLPNLSSRWGQLESETLELNFRSSPVVLETTNGVFEGLKSNAALAEFPETAGVWAERYRTHRAGRGSMPGVARLYIGPGAGEDAGKEEQMLAMLEFAAQRAEAILALQPRMRIGVLVRTNKWISQMIFELRRLGIEASEEGGNPLTDSAAVAAAVSLLQLADHPGDTAALYHVATSPLGAAVGLTDARDEGRARGVAADIRRRVSREGYAAYLRWLLLRCASEMDGRGAARFEQLIDLAQEFDAGKGSRASELVRIVQERGVEEPGRQNVSVMTIHKSKGLEFDAVILPELDRPWMLKHEQVLTDRRGADGERSAFGPVVAVTRYPASEIRALHGGLAELHRHWQERQIGEELCCLYVALTRAVHVLEMIVPPPKASESKLPLCAAGVLRGALCPVNGGAPGELAWEVRNGPDEAWAAHIEAEQKRAQGAGEGAEVKLALAAAARVPLGRLRRRTPSSLEGGDMVDMGMIWSAGGEGARDRGSLVHAWFEAIEWLDDGLPADEVLLARGPALGLERAAAREVLEEFKICLAGAVGQVLQRSAYAGCSAEVMEVRREWPFAVRDCDPQTGAAALLSGQFDRVVIGIRGGRAVWAEIVDFKTDRVADEEGLMGRVEMYRPQVRAYRRAAGALLGIEEVSARLAFTRAGKVVEVE
jgi:ATP-dependent helicase/nuclease subunit A